MNLVGSLREKIIYTVQAARNAATPAPRAELKLRNVNMFLNGLVSVELNRADNVRVSMPRCWMLESDEFTEMSRRRMHVIDRRYSSRYSLVSKQWGRVRKSEL